MKKNLFWWISISIVLCGIFSAHEFDGRYGRSINGDGKAYYAYLPAIFIYQDPTFSFIDEVELKYYPTDKSQFKDFRNKQKNGKYVNKTFPGLSVLYAPFFFLSMFFAWVGGFAVDGYSAPFQWGIAFSHVVYFFIGLRFLLSVFRCLKIRDAVSYLVFTGLIFGTNSWYYLLYDHTVSHIHNFFLATVFMWMLLNWIQTKRMQYLGWSGIILSLLIITRPTNGLMLLFLPLLTMLSGKKLKDLITKEYFQFKRLMPYVIIGLIIFSIPFLLWKWQSDLWLVYSYNEEGFNFKQPHFFDFLYSYQKGWFVWSPLVFLSIIASGFYFSKKSLFQLVSFMFPLVLIVYVLSSWWCWTYGAGFGQRPMIDFLPFIAIGVALFLNEFKRSNFVYFVILPFCFLSMIQSYQITNSILSGGTTTKDQYWSHFLQLKRDAPTVVVSANWKLIDQKELNSVQKIDKGHPFSQSIKSSKLKSVKIAVLMIEIGSNTRNPDLRLVISNQDGTLYKDVFLGDFISGSATQMEFKIELSDLKNQILSYYVWNGDSETDAEITRMELKCYK
jgi:hypothetical protein